jgi:hypothetical protein
MSAGPGEDGSSSGATPPSGGEVLTECRQLYLDRLRQSARDAGLSEESALEALQRGSGEFFDAMASRQGRAGFEQAKGLTASRISLVNDRDLAISIKLGEMSRLLSEATAAQLWKLSLRLAALIGRENVDPVDNPLGAEAVCAGLAEMCTTLRCDLDTANSLLDGIGTRLARELPVIYAELNELLVRRNIHPVRRPRAGTGSSGKTRSPGGDPFDALQRAVAERTPAVAPIPSKEPPPAGGLAYAGPALQAAVSAAMDQLLARLDAQQAANGGGDLFSTAPAASTAPLRSIREGSLQSMLTGVQSQTIDGLALIFDAVFADPRLPDAVKVAYSRLQIPVLKASILDPSFFSDPEHPARSLLDEIGRCAVGLPPDAAADHPLCAAINDAASRVAAEFRRDPDVFDRQAAAMETRGAQRAHDLQRATEAYIPLALEQERWDIATARARAANDPTLASLPPPLAEFIRDDWRRVLAAIHVSEGADSAAWQDACGVAADLAWSIEPKPNPDDRRRLVALIPALLRRITSGLQRIGVAAAERQQLFDACFELQTAVLKGKTMAPSQTPTPAAAEPSAPVLSESTAAGLTLRTLHGSSDDAGALSRHIDAGAWVELELPGGVRVCGRHCWTSPNLHMLLLGNPDWQYALLVAPGLLERQFKSGKAAVSGRSSLFADAAERALRTLA